MSREGFQNKKIHKAEGIVESSELRESIERAKELRAQLEEFRNTDIFGREGLAKVEAIAHALSIELSNISGEICLQEGLPYHPMDKKFV